jgi:hypothetical protein
MLLCSFYIAKMHSERIYLRLHSQCTEGVQLGFKSDLRILLVEIKIGGRMSEHLNSSHHTSFTRISPHGSCKVLKDLLWVDHL